MSYVVVAIWRRLTPPSGVDMAYVVAIWRLTRPSGVDMAYVVAIWRLRRRFLYPRPMLRSSLLALGLLLFAAPASAGDHEWAAGEIKLPIMTAYAEAVDAAIGKTLVKGPRHKKHGGEAHLLITATDGGSRASYVRGSLDAEQQTELEAWARKWILPVGEPGMALPVKVWWEKPGKDEKEKLKKGQEPTRPSPGMRYSVGFAAEVAGAVEASVVLTAAGLVFTSSERCVEEVADMRRPTMRASFWHLDVDGTGAVTAMPQDLYVPPPDPTTREGKRALAAMEEAAAAEAPAVEGAPEAPAVEAPKVEAPKFELPGGAAPPEKPEKPAEEEAEPTPPPREWTPLEVCVGAALTEARIRAPADGGATLVDHLPVLVRRP